MQQNEAEALRRRALAVYHAATAVTRTSSFESTEQSEPVMVRDRRPSERDIISEPREDAGTTPE